MSSVIVSQSKPNWAIIKQLYLQGAKSPLPPEPTYQRLTTQQELEEYAKPLLLEMEECYKQCLAELQQRTQKSIEQLNLRIFALEEQVISLQQQSRQKASQIARLIPAKAAQKDRDDCEDKFIHIEEQQEQQEESLLQPEVLQKPLEPQMITVRKGRKSTNSRRLFQDESASRMKYQYSEMTRPLSTKTSAYFDRDRDRDREELNTLRSLIQTVHGIKLEEYPSPPLLEAQTRVIEVDPSKNEVKHLRNENQQLREVVDRLRMELQRAQIEVGKVRQLLLVGLEEDDFGPYAKSDLF